MDDYTRKTHIKNYFENGRKEPRILLESPTEEGDFIEYSSTLISSSIVEYNGLIPDSMDIEIQVWHASSTIDDPVNYVPSEYESINSIVKTKTNENSLEEKVKEWSDSKVDKGNYQQERGRFLKNVENNRGSYCSTLLTCSCGTRKVMDSVSQAIGQRDTDHIDNNHNPMIWFYCGTIDKQTREKSYSVYEGARSRSTSIIQKIRGSDDEKDPIDLVPIHYTPLSVALQEVGAYEVTEHSTRNAEEHGQEQ